MSSEALVYLAFRGGATMNGWMVSWVVMQDGVDVAFGRDFSYLSEGSERVQPVGLQAYVEAHPSEAFTLLSFKPQGDQHFDWIQPANAHWVDGFPKSGSEHDGSTRPRSRKEVKLAQRIVQGLITEHQDCYRDVRITRDNGVTFAQSRQSDEQKEKKRNQRANKRQRDYFVKHFNESWFPEAASTQKAWVVATDGSYRHKDNPNHVGAYAWVASDGGYGRGELARSSSNLVELAGIFFALMSAPSDASEIKILTDSKNSLSLLNNECVQSGVFGCLVSLIRKAMEDKPVTFEWVKAHRGHPLNHAADRVASRYDGQKDLMEQAVLRGVKNYAKGLNFAGDGYYFG